MRVNYLSQSHVQTTESAPSVMTEQFYGIVYQLSFDRYNLSMSLKEV